MLSGHAGEDVKTFRLLKGQLGVKTTEEFNKLNAAERVKRMSGLLEKNKGMLKAFENTWDAISSTTASIMKNISLAFGGPLFETAKHGLKAVNDLLGQYSAKINLVAGVLGKLAAGGIERIAGAVGSRIPRGGAMGLQGPKGVGFANSLPSLGGAAVGLYGGPIGGLLAGGFLKALNQPGFLESFKNIFNPLRGVITSFSAMWESATDRIRDGFLMLGSFFDSTFMPIINAVSGVFGGLFDTFKQIFDDKSNAFIEIFYYVGIIGEGFSKVLAPAISLLGKGLTYLYDKVIRGFIDVMTWGLQHVAAAVRVLELAINAQGLAKIGLLTGGGIGKAYQDALVNVQVESQKRLGKTATGADTNLGKVAVAFDAAIENAEKAAAQARGNKPVVAKPPPAKVEFHNAKFNIEQAFAPGSDPDRVAVAFKRGVGESVMNRVNSAGLTPLFTPT